MIPDPHALLPVAYRAAAKVIHNPFLAEEAGERALHLLTLAMLQGCPPHHPEAWLRIVARRSACALLRSEWFRTRTVDAQTIRAQQAPYRIPRSLGVDVVREHLHDRLTPRQQAAFDAAIACNSTRAAARSCGMQPRDFRRHLGTISRKAKRLLGDRRQHDAYADDPAVQFQLGS
ncbi:MAG TPA: hypothetical protein VFZ65_15390 [Planctomycetota bacterium]|nr:hypothetical protein [Planctomycetota bacterium]